MTPATFKSWRKTMNLSVSESARRLGRNRRAIQRWESGESKLNKTIMLACAALEAGLQPWSKK